jgi:lipopolysaccharide/colanic/teichoic acid biosynthesis glycosyltransferase
MSTVSDQTFEPLIVSPHWSEPLETAAKRGLDVLLSGMLLVVLAPLLFLLALAVKMTSPGPVFYAWRVVGKNGRPFTGYKIRSMVQNADELKEKLEEQNEMTGPVFKMIADPRITPLGSWMRRYSLDELPQLYSVLKGDMALVGPRPPLRTEYQRFTEYQKQKLEVKPGLTCLWQVNGRSEVRDFNEWVRLDLEYIHSWSLGLDFKILCKTFWVVVSGSGR